MPFSQDFHEALQQQHHAAQLIALAGKYLLPQQADDSNTNMQYIPETELLAGNPLLNRTRLALHLNTLKLIQLDKGDKSINPVSLAGMTFARAFQAMKDMLDSAGVDTSHLSDQLHYEIPDHPLSNGGVFHISDQKYFQQNALIRHNTEILLHELIADYSEAAPVRVWPHHFDTGTFIPLTVNDQGAVTKSIGLGWAIPDAMVNEPYYYLSFWSENNISVPQLEKLPAGEWMMPEWNGAVLRHSELLRYDSAAEQFTTALTFFRSGIRQINKILL